MRGTRSGRQARRRVGPGQSGHTVGVDDHDRQQRMCGSKARHRNQAAAEEAIERRRWDQASGDPALSCYPCDYCHQWHLTSQTPRWS